VSLDTSADRCRAVLEVRGEFDLATGDTLARWVEALDPHVRELILDLSGLAFIDSSGIGALLQTRERAAESGRELTLIHPQPQVLGVLARLGLLGHLRVLQ